MEGGGVEDGRGRSRGWKVSCITEGWSHGSDVSLPWTYQNLGCQ